MKGKLTLYVSVEESKKWKHAAIDQDVSLSEMMRRAMKLYLEKLEAERAEGKKAKG